MTHTSLYGPTRTTAGLTFTLTPEQSAQQEEGGWSETRLIEDLCLDLERLGVTEPVTVVLDTGAIAFSLTASGGRPC